MITLKKITSQLIAAAMLVTSLCVSDASIVTAAEAFAESTDVYTREWSEDITVFDADNDEDYKIFTSRTTIDIANMYSEALYAAKGYDDNDPTTWYSETPSLEYPYDPGMISEDARKAMLAMTNFYRWLMGLNLVTENTNKMDQLQTGAMVRNFYYAHGVEGLPDEYKPADMSDEMWEYGVYDGNNILNKNSTPQQSITSWMNEGCKIFDIDPETNVMFPTEVADTVSHRSILTSINLEEITFAHCEKITSGFIRKNNDGTIFENSIPFVAYPCPGYMPSSLVNPQICAWSFELNPKDLYIKDDDTSDIKITITNTRTGEIFERNVLTKNTGCISFKQPEDFAEEGFDGTYGYIDNYKVEIDGLYATETDLPAKISYTVKFFDMEHSTKVLSTETHRTYYIHPDMINEEDLKYVASILPEEVSVRAENGRFYAVPVGGKWTADMENGCFVNSANADWLPSHVSDPNALLSRIEIPFVAKTGRPLECDTLDFEPSTVDVGDDINITVRLSLGPMDSIDLYRLIDLPNGDCTSVRMAAIGGLDYYCEQFEEHTIKSAALGDTGKYISVYYCQLWMNDKVGSGFYVSNSIAELTVNTPCTCVTSTATTTNSSVSIQSTPAAYGDMNLDGSVTLVDVIYLNKYIAGSIKISDDQISKIDVCQDGTINASDASVLLQYSVEAITAIPVIP